MHYLDHINSPLDLKKLSVDELPALADEVRSVLLQKISNAGGHIGPNLAMVETTVALHYVFNSPADKIVFDVSHQSYPHKILTGRRQAFTDPAHYHDVNGYTNPAESEHDFFTVGHTSTSVSLACGLAKARDLTGGHENIIAVIGDGSLSGGEAYEGLNNAVEGQTNMIVVVNDNEMSIAENHGGLYQNLKLLRDTDGKAENNFFKAIGFDYIYVKNGHDLRELVTAFQSVKDTPRPVVVHIHTIKGKGFAPAEEHKETYHAGGPFDLKTGAWKYAPAAENYCQITADYLRPKMREDKSIAVITSGTPVITGFSPEERSALGKQFIDVGIAEEHAVALASGMARNGAKPVYFVFSSFIQRTYDQLSQDLCLNNNPAVILVFSASLNGFNDATHLGRFDIPMMSNIPNLVYLAPTCREEYLAMLEWGLNQKDHPVAIRVPGGFGCEELWSCGCAVTPDFSALNTFKTDIKGQDAALLALGAFYRLGKEVAEELAKDGVNATLINPRFITGLDEEALNGLKENHRLVVTLEDGQIEGGFGEKVDHFYADSAMKVLNYGGNKEFTDRLSADEIKARYHLTPRQIADEIMEAL
ncbi:MAG: 1-deoxy-D-xylulose-5-phosphate synthase [Alphaproteobacteria bacterium]